MRGECKGGRGSGLGEMELGGMGGRDGCLVSNLVGFQAQDSTEVGGASAWTQRTTVQRAGQFDSETWQNRGEHPLEVY